MIQSADKKNRPEKTDTKSHAEKAAHTGGKSTYLRDSPLKKKKKNAHTSWAVFPLLLECPCFPFRNTTGSPVSSLLSFIRPQIVRAEAASQRSDSSAIRHAFGLQRCLFLSILLCTPGSLLQSNSTTWLLAPNCLSLSSPNSLGSSFLSSVSKKAE